MIESARETGVRAGRRRPRTARLGIAAAVAVTALIGVVVPHAEAVQSRRGFSAEVVTALLQDRAGFLWIGTREGLTVYDGYTFVTSDHDVGDPTSISDNLVRTIHEDRDGVLWIGTNSGGLNRLDRAAWTFEHFRHDSSDPASLSHDSVNVILQEREGALWVGTQRGLNRMDPVTGEFRRFLPSPEDADGIPHDYIYALHEDADGTLWIGTVGGGLVRRDPTTGRFTQLRHDPQQESSLPADGVFALVADARDRLWIGTDGGLAVLDPSRTRLERVPFDAGSDEPLVTSLTVDGSTLWIGTWHGGPFRIDVESRAPVPPARPEHAPEPGTRLTALLVDREGALWAATWGAGLKRVHPHRLSISALPASDGTEGAGLNDATAVLEDRDGRLWVGTWGFGLNSRESGDGRIRRHLSGSGTVLALHVDRDGGVWSGTMNDLQRLDPATGRVQRFAHDPDAPDGLGPGYVRAILQDRGGRLWVGTGEGGLHRLREDGGTFERFAHDPADPTSLSDDYVTVIHEDRSGTLWIGTRSGGLNAWNSVGGAFERHVPVPGDERSLSHHYVTAIVEDDQGVLWVATAGGGLNRLDRDGQAPTFSRITERDGLADDNVLVMLPDDDGSLWLGTAEGLSRFHPGRDQFANFDGEDGLPSTEFNVGAAWRGRENLYFGTSAGVVVVPRGAAFPESAPSPTVLRSIRTPAGAVAGDRPPWSLERLEVPYGEVLSFEFTVMDFADPANHRYAYRLEGSRAGWVDLGLRREITFTDLDPGRYTLHVRGRNGQGVWSQAPTPLQIAVVPPFWMAGWFRALLALAVVGLAVGGHRVRTAALERRNRELRALKDQREQALEEAHRSQDELHGTYARLRRLTRRLEAAKEDERKRIARELHDEMGQALTAAKINLQVLGGLPDTSLRQQRIDDTVEVLDRMIDHVRTLSLDLRPPLLDELGFVAAIRGYVESQAQRSGVRFDVTADPLPQLSAELEIVAFRVIQEAVTNVLRHAAATSVAITIRDDDPSLLLSIEDDGRGFDVEDALERGGKGHHLGLLGIRERVEGLGGEVRIDSAPGAGARVTVRVPFSP